MAKKDIIWTEQQRRAITQRGSDVLVTASAGTGKTAVLSGRCVDIVSDKSVCGDVLSMLVVTFTNAASEQMRCRIAEQLRRVSLAVGEGELGRHLRWQLLLLAAADISTIHSFCKRLITEYFYELDLDPTFRVIESDEAKLLKSEVLEKTINWAWQQGNLQQALEQLLGGRDLRTTDGFLGKIIGLSDFLDGVVSRQNWYERAGVLAEAANPFTTELGEKQRQIVGKRLQLILERIRYAQKLYENEKTGGSWAEKWEDNFIGPVAQCIGFLKEGDWDKCAEGIRNYQRPSRFEYKPRGVKGPIADVIKKAAEGARKAFDGLFELAVLNPEYLEKVGGGAGLQTKVLIELVRKFDRLYSEAKRAINCLDFADLEHYALRLLADESRPSQEGLDEDSSDDKLLPSKTAIALRRKYKYIFVDEYQDINPVQQAILDLLSSGDNIFVVGDVKQSIYTWRGAKSEVFLERLKTASAEPSDAAKGLRVDLNANFRSAGGILDFVNKVFGRIMTGSFAKIDYDESARLRPALVKEIEGDSGPVVELHILDETDIGHRGAGAQEDEGDNENLDAISFDDGDLSVYSGRQRQAAMIARRIRQMVGAETGRPEFQIYDKQQDKFRTVQYGDIVILMRSPAKRANDYVEVLRLAGVPVSCEAATGYFETTEISDMLCLLKVLDNPQRDIELAAVLRSPFFKIGDAELAKIKIHGGTDERSKNYYGCVVDYCDCGEDVELADRLKGIVGAIERWRAVARRGSLADLVWQIYRQTGYLSFVSALPNGQQRRANLLKLHDRAIQFEGFVSSGGVASLRRFVEFIEKLQQAGGDWAKAEPEAEVEDAVRIISVHKSKGLEFPVVFLVELDSGFNKRDAQDDFLADANDTLGLRIIDRQSNSKLSSLAHQVIAESKLSEVLAEEMRILYVAMTRARERLILSACEKRGRCRDIICDGFLSGGGSVGDWQLLGSRSHLDWVLYGLCDQKNLHSVFETGLGKRLTAESAENAEKKLKDDGLFSLKVHGRPELQQLSGYIHKLKTQKSCLVTRAPGHELSASAGKKLDGQRAEPKLLAQVKKSLGWRYGFGDVIVLPAKRSVTELTHRADEYIKVDYSAALQRRPRVLCGDLISPAEGRLTGAATHLVIARLDLGEPMTCEAVEKTKERLLDEGAISEIVSEHIDTGSIMTFFESELGKAVLEPENMVWREWAFTFSLPASEWKDTHLLRDTRCEIRDTIIVQGIIDMLVEKRDGLVVIDFKTDNVTADEVGERAELYREQLELYGKAASAILKKPIEGGWLYFLKAGCAIEIKD